MTGLAAGAASGWLIGIMVEVAGEPQPLRHYWAVGQPDRARAEWAAVDRAVSVGAVATSPVGGQEPVQAVAALSAARMKALGLAPGEVRALGWKHPRRWLAA